MEIAIISDIHDNIFNLKKCLAWCKKKKIEKIICCGDVTNSDTLQILSREFPGEIFIVCGNMEIYQEAEVADYKNFTFGCRTAVFEIDGKKVGVCHEPFLIDQVLAQANNKEFPSPGGVAAAAGVGFPNNIDIIFYGHTHKPWIETKNGVQIVNPGTLGGVFTQPTFAFWDTVSGKLELELLNSLKV
ncbi:MAG: YfcE family phosphodiesterase [Patescibacteria group bacterium]|nr:YfcE family phosphodiesterase [Patescibacteria group bacterium]